MRTAGHVALTQEEKEEENSYTALVGKQGGRRLLGRPRHRWENNITMDPGETG
jgi:hypothetical protein